MPGFRSWIKTTQGIIVSITALFLVIPSLINAGKDIYVELLDIPTGLKESQNDVLYRFAF